MVDVWFTDVVITDHALSAMQHRGISEAQVRDVLAAAEQAYYVRPGRLVMQSRILSGSEESPYLLRVFVDVDRVPAEVVTAYRTSRVAKYWRLTWI